MGWTSKVLELPGDATRFHKREAILQKLGHCLYHADLTSQYAQQKAARLSNTRLQKLSLQEHQRVSLQLGLVNKPLPVSEASIFQQSLFTHARDLAEQGCVYSIDTNDASIVDSLPEAMSSNVFRSQTSILGAIEDAESSSPMPPLHLQDPVQHKPTQDCARLFFKILDRHPSNARLLRVPGASSGRSRLQPSDMCVSLLPILRQRAGADEWLVAMECAASSCNAVHVLHSLGHDALQTLQQWTLTGDAPLWYLPEHAGDRGETAGIVSHLFTMRAFSEEKPAALLDRQEAKQEFQIACASLVQEGVLVQVIDEAQVSRYYFSIKGLQRIRPAVRVARPKSLTMIRTDVPLEMLSHFELLKTILGKVV